jgi:hypothetical protein
VSRHPVVWLCGPPGVGKSSAGWALFARWTAAGSVCGYVDIDQLAICLPFHPDEGATTRLKATNLHAVLENYQAAGAGSIVITGVALPTEVATFIASTTSARITWVRLRAEPSQLHARFVQRDGPIDLLPEVDRHAEELAASQFANLTIDTTALSPVAVAEAVDRALPRAQHNAHPTGPPRRSAQTAPGPNDRPAHVLLLTGPRAVGTSTVGWELLQLAQQHMTTAFIDLAQVGFVNEHRNISPRRHPLRAANLADIASNYQHDGARLVIAVGSVLDADELSEYSALLTPGGLTVCRLHAVPEEVQRRVIARSAASGGPHLAGDDLRGRPAAEIRRVTEQSLAEADLLEQSKIGHITLDTTKMSPSECATAIWQRAGLN